MSDSTRKKVYSFSALGLALMVFIGALLPFLLRPRFASADEPERYPSASRRYYMASSPVLVGSDNVVLAQVSSPHAFSFFCPVLYIESSLGTPIIYRSAFFGFGPSFNTRFSIPSTLSSVVKSNFKSLSSSDFFFPYGFGFCSYSAADFSSTWGVKIGSSSDYYSLYPSSDALGARFYGYNDPVSQAEGEGDASCSYYFAYGDSNSAFVDGHVYHIELFACSSVASAGETVAPELYFTGVNMMAHVLPSSSTQSFVWFDCVGPDAYFVKPSFVPSTFSDDNTFVTFSPAITPSSFFDTTEGDYIYPFESLRPSSPLPPPSSGDYEQGYKDGYTDGLNKGQSDGFTNPVGTMLNPVIDFMNLKLFGEVSLGNIFSIVMFVLFAIIFIKLFAGG